MDIQFFQTFLIVAKLGNMTQAAEMLNFTQPTITGQIRTLEQHFGVKLFDRVGKKLYITDAGKKLINYSERLLSVYNEALEEVSIHPGSINLGIATTMVNYVFMPSLQKLQKQVQNCSITVEMCSNTSAVVKGIIENRFDLGFIQNSVSADFLNGFELFKEQLVWVVHQKVAERNNYSANILDYPLLAYKVGGLFRELYEKALGRKAFETTIEYTDSEVMKNAILQGLGCGALPSVMINQLLKDGVLIEFENIPRSDFSIWIVFHKDKVLSRPAMALLKILQEDVTTNKSAQ